MGYDDLLGTPKKREPCKECDDKKCDDKKPLKEPKLKVNLNSKKDYWTNKYKDDPATTPNTPYLKTMKLYWRCERGNY